MVKFGDIARDLINLEINTIEKENMTAQKMPSWPHALLDISNDYLNSMIALGLDPRPYWGTDDKGQPELLKIPKPDAGQNVEIWTDQKPVFDSSQLRNGYRDFGHLRWLAIGLANNPDVAKRLSADERATHMQVLERITRNCDELREIVIRLAPEGSRDGIWNDYIGKTRREVITAIRKKAPPPLDVADATRVRKIWDVGTERVALQTVIQIDGDVITRVRADLADAEANLLYQAHLQGIKTSVESWRFLVEIVGKLAGKAASVLIAGRS